MSHLLIALPEDFRGDYPLSPFEKRMDCLGRLSRSSMDELNHRIYELLQVSHFYRPASGTGQGAWFTARQINEAMTRLIAAPDMARLGEEAEFLLGVYGAMHDPERIVAYRSNAATPVRQEKTLTRCFIYFY